MTLLNTLRTEPAALRLGFHARGERAERSASELHTEAREVAGLLRERGLEPGASVGVLGPNDPRWLASLFGIWAAGGVAVPIAYPLRIGRPDIVREHVAALVRAARCAAVLAAPALLELAPEGLGLDWTDSGAVGSEASPGQDAPAVIQFTSGSTAAPRGAVLSHGAIVAALEGLRQRAVHVDGDAQLSWQPFFHDMGLFGFPLRAIHEGFRCELMTTEAFARDPVAWFRLARQTGATILGGPPTAWEAAIRAASRSGERLDLSAVRRTTLGAERIDPKTVDLILSWGSRWGLRRDAVCVAYGLAEATVAVTMTEMGAVRTLEVAPEALADGRVEPGPERLVACGPPLSGTEVLIGSPDAPLGPGRVGEILVRSDALMDGYLGVPEEGQPFRDGWLRTGDVGFMEGGELVPTGRSKDLIIVFGRNYAPESLEWAAGGVPGVRTGRVVAFSPDGSDGEVVVALEPRDGADPEELAVLVRRAVADAVGLSPRHVLVVPPETIPKTTSGKLRRGLVREAYQSGSLAP